ncbi:hypothetical protein [Thermoactinospora rubra]|uniref:hypothetical protein n=1 Tax=Thermoactinospora rubra TaxID=1088767 RepID=UPI000A10FE7A|nr:hypothetical protein [Thermoactinospora rubra]
MQDRRTDEELTATRLEEQHRDAAEAERAEQERAGQFEAQRAREGQESPEPVRDEATSQPHDYRTDLQGEQPLAREDENRGEPATYDQDRDEGRDELRVPGQRADESATTPGAATTPSAAPSGTATPEAGDVLIAPEPEHAHAVPYQGGDALLDRDPAQVRERWRDVQSGFVDEPRQAVERADELVEELVVALTTSLTGRTNELRDRWKNAGEQDTEQLRRALRDYRAVLERLLTLSEGR